MLAMNFSIPLITIQSVLWRDFWRTDMNTSFVSISLLISSESTVLSGSINRLVASFTIRSSFSEPFTSTSDEWSFGRVEKITCTPNSASTSFTYGVSLSGGVLPGAKIGSSNEINSGVELRTSDRARSTPSMLPHIDTWLLFSVGFERFESGNFCRSTLNRSTCRSSGLATPSWAAISLRSPQSLSTDEISLVVSLGGPPFRKICLLNDEQDAIILLTTISACSWH
uniref:Uncharacterized protein n=1 Tax=Anopheles farauti TaxID=69004 RepID=A0A182QWW2_9DIPT